MRGGSAIELSLEPSGNCKLIYTMTLTYVDSAYYFYFRIRATMPFDGDFSTIRDRLDDFKRSVHDFNVAY